MCHALPAKVAEIIDEDQVIVNLGGIEKQISTALIDPVEIGDYVIIHVGYALTKLNEQEAKKTLALFDEMTKL